MQAESPKFAPVPMAALMTGLSVKDIDRYIKTGKWLEGHEFRRNLDGTILIDFAGLERWVLGKRPAAAPPVNGGDVVVVKQAKPADPVPTALYRHFGEGDALLYVGISLSPVARLSKHADASHWSRQITRVSIEWFPSRSAALAAEARAILDENPAHNIAGRIARD